jgi:hypothetical protein
MLPLNRYAALSGLAWSSPNVHSTGRSYPARRDCRNRYPAELTISHEESDSATLTRFWLTACPPMSTAPVNRPDPAGMTRGNAQPPSPRSRSIRGPDVSCPVIPATAE